MNPMSTRYSSNVLEGHQPYSRVGEVICHAYADKQSWQKVKDTKSHFHEWASVVPGHICLIDTKTKSSGRMLLNSTAVAVVTSADGYEKEEENWDHLRWAGVCRSKSTTEQNSERSELFTLAMRGVVAVVNSSGTNLYPGDTVYWTVDAKPSKAVAALVHEGPTRFTIARYDDLSDGEAKDKQRHRVFGTVMQMCHKNMPCDILLKDSFI